MRQGPHVKRPRGRSGQSGGNGSGNNASSSARNKNVPLRHQTFDSNGPDVRVRGSALQVYEKYLALGRDAALAGDRVGAENYHQHAEHYFRLLNANPENGQAAQSAPRNGSDGDPQPATDLAIPDLTITDLTVANLATTDLGAIELVLEGNDDANGNGISVKEIDLTEATPEPEPITLQ